MPASRLPLLAAAAAALVTVGALLLTGAGSVAPSVEPPPGPVVDREDRAALDAAPVLRGADAPPPDPGTTFTDPAAVARAFLRAAHTTEAADAGGTHLRAAPYAVPGSAAAVVGVLVLDPPPPGTARTASVRRLDLVAADHDDLRRGYLAVVETRDSPGGATAVLRTGVVVTRQPGGRWLVAAEAPDDPDLAVGED